MTGLARFIINQTATIDKVCHTAAEKNHCWKQKAEITSPGSKHKMSLTKQLTKVNCSSFCHCLRSSLWMTSSTVSTYCGIKPVTADTTSSQWLVFQEITLSRKKSQWLVFNGTKLDKQQLMTTIYWNKISGKKSQWLVFNKTGQTTVNDNYLLEQK